MLSLLVGVGLSAACGFRVFVPLLVMSIASHTGHLTLSPSFQWIGSDVALVALALATILEVTAYYVPWLDNFLDTIATPAAIVAGTVVTAAMVSDMSPFLKWTLAAIAGGGAAGLVQTATVLARGASTATTGGLANPLFATIELGGAFLASTMLIWMPLVAVLLFIVIGIFVVKKLMPKLSKAQFFR